MNERREYTVVESVVEQMLEIQRSQLQISQFILYELRAIRRQITPSTVTGGKFRQTGNPVVSIQPGNSPKFQVTPTFSGPSFPLVGAEASVATSDPTNAPASIDLTDDPTGATFILNLLAGAVIAPGGEALTVTWTYLNADGVPATVTGTVTEEGIVDDVTGGTFAQIA